MDVFLSRLVVGLEGNPEQNSRALEEINKHMMYLVFNKNGCRIVQKALKIVGSDILLGSLCGQVNELWRDGQANYVLVMVVEVMPPHLSRFVAEELVHEHQAVLAATHRFGIRVICRLIEKANDDNATKRMLAEILEKAEVILLHRKKGAKWLRIVVNHIILFGASEQAAWAERIWKSAKCGRRLTEQIGRACRDGAHSPVWTCPDRPSQTQTSPALAPRPVQPQVVTEPGYVYRRPGPGRSRTPSPGPASSDEEAWRRQRTLSPEYREYHLISFTRPAPLQTPNCLSSSGERSQY